MRRSREGRNGIGAALLAATAVAVAAACAEETPTSIDPGVLPGAPVTLEIELPWSAFGSDLAVLGGYGSPRNAGPGIVASEFAGVLTARTLIRLGGFPASASVRDTAGTTVTDTALAFTGGELWATFRRRASTNDGPVELALGALQQAWHAPSASWAYAVDTVGSQVPWPEPGAGPVVPLDTAVWDPAQGDSVFFALDSAEVAAWEEDGDARARGARVDLQTLGERLEIQSFGLRLTTRPSVNPDTLIELSVPGEDLTFVYTPDATPPADGLRVGGAPAWRSVLDVAVPEQLTGPQELCDAVGCPVQLEPGQISYAALVLQTRAPEAGFRPTDSLGVDVRTVLRRSALPKAPLGAPLVGGPGVRVPSSYFESELGTRVEIPITSFVRNLVQGVDTLTGQPYPSTLALLSAPEPAALAYASFFGPGAAQAPVLKLIVTVGTSVELP